MWSQFADRNIIGSYDPVDGVRLEAGERVFICNQFGVGYRPASRLWIRQNNNNCCVGCRRSAGFAETVLAPIDERVAWRSVFQTGSRRSRTDTRPRSGYIQRFLRPSRPVVFGAAWPGLVGVITILLIGVMKPFLIVGLTVLAATEAALLYRRSNLGVMVAIGSLVFALMVPSTTLIVSALGGGIVAALAGGLITDLVDRFATRAPHVWGAGFGIGVVPLVAVLIVQFASIEDSRAVPQGSESTVNAVTPKTSRRPQLQDRSTSDRQAAPNPTGSPSGLSRPPTVVPAPTGRGGARPADRRAPPATTPGPRPIDRAIPPNDSIDSARSTDPTAGPRGSLGRGSAPKSGISRAAAQRMFTDADRLRGDGQYLDAGRKLDELRNALRGTPPNGFDVAEWARRADSLRGVVVSACRAEAVVFVIRGETPPACPRT